MFATLTKKQKEILDFIKVYFQLNGYSPSLEDIKNHFQLAAISTVHEHIQNLKLKGYIHKEINQARGIRPVNPELKHEEFVEVPIIGTLDSKGRMSPSKNVSIATLHKGIVDKAGKYFGLLFRTEEENPNGLQNGDLLIIKEQDSFHDGEAILAEENKNFLLVGRVFHYNKAFKFLPLNPFQTGTEHAQYFKTLSVKGKLVSLIRNFA